MIMDRKFFKPFLAFSIFALFFLWGWRIHDILHDIPAYTDVLEILWGMEWYHEALFEKRIFPLSLPLIFHPLKWHSITLGYSPLVFVLALPFYELGSVALAYNALVISALLVAFWGAFSFLKKFSSPFFAACAAAIFTFSAVNWFQARLHPNILWALGLLPWLALTLENCKSHPTGKCIGVSGCLLGLMTIFSFYGFFAGLILFVLWGGKLFTIRGVKSGVSIILMALLLSLPTILIFWFSMQEGRVHYYGIEHNLHWGASLNSLFIPSVFHPLLEFRRVALSIYKGPCDEAGIANLGFLTWILTFIGAVRAVKSKNWGLIFLVLCGLSLSMGLLLKWDDKPLHFSLFNPLITGIWKAGHAIKPKVFLSREPPAGFEGGIPLPGLFLIAFAPFWELARVFSRYAAVGLLGMLALGSMALNRMPKYMRYILVAIWMVESLPVPVNGVPVPYELHPAYEWLAEQALISGEGIVDIAYPTLIMGPEILWGAWLHGKPTASGTGSYWPEYSYWLWAYFLQNNMSNPDVGLVLSQYHVRYLFLHVYGEREKEMWNIISHNPSLRPIRCFEPKENNFPWNYPICVAEVLNLNSPVNIIPEEGWSQREEWGIWANGRLARAMWLALARKDHMLFLEAFPLCLPGENQRMDVKINKHLVAVHEWEDCNLWEGSIRIPASLIEEGFNELVFEFKYALSPNEITGGKNPDLRKLAVGFRKLKVEEVK